jgi:hypothetical protein
VIQQYVIVGLLPQPPLISLAPGATLLLLLLGSSIRFEKLLNAWCYDTMLIFLEYEIVAMGRRSMNVDVAVMR